MLVAVLGGVVVVADGGCCRFLFFLLPCYFQLSILLPSVFLFFSFCSLAVAVAVVVAVVVLLTMTGRNGGTNDSSSKRDGMAMRSYCAGRRFFFFYVFFLLLCFYSPSFSLSLLFLIFCFVHSFSLFCFCFPLPPLLLSTFVLPCFLLVLFLFYFFLPLSCFFSLISSTLSFLFFSFTSPLLISSSPPVFIGGRGRGPLD